MTSEHEKWQKLKDNYLRHVEQVLASIDHPKSADVLRDVDEHLERKFSELSPDKQNWEGCHQILVEMGPPQDYAELLAEDQTTPASKGIGINEYLAIAFVIVLMVVGGYLIYTAKNMPATAPPPAPAAKSFEFELDQRVIGKWVTVDFVDHIEDFDPSRKSWPDELFLLSLDFQSNGEVRWEAENRKLVMIRWTKGKVEPYSRRPTFYYLKDLDGQTFLFYEWISGDVTIRGQKPSYYVLKKAGQ